MLLGGPNVNNVQVVATGGADRDMKVWDVKTRERKSVSGTRTDVSGDRVVTLSEAKGPISS